MTTTATETKEKIDSNLVRKVHNEIGFDELKHQAAYLIKSGFLPDSVETPEQAVVIMLTGRELGMSPMESFRSIYVVHKKPSLSAQLMLALCERTKQLENKVIEQGKGYCKVTLKRKGQDPYTLTVTREQMDQAKFSQQWDRDKKAWVTKDNWVKQESTMLLWRAVSAACRVVFPDAVTGLYTPDELGAVVDFTPSGEIREVIEAPIEPNGEEEIETQSNKDVLVEGDDIPDDQLANWKMPIGKYKDMTLSRILGEMTESGKAKGLEYLQWCMTPQAKISTEIKSVVERFLRLHDTENFA